MPRRVSAGLAMTVGLTILVTSQAHALEIFGFKLFGGEDEDNTVEVIDPLAYSVSVSVSGGDSDLKDTVEAASALVQRKDAPASGTAGLLATARGDYRRILAALYEAGHYSGAISITAGGREVGAIPLSARLAGPVPVQISVEPGPLFTFGQTGFRNAPPPPTDPRDVVPTEARDLFRTGQPARASAIADATDEAIRQWRELGYPKARRADRQVVADHGNNRLDAIVALDPGREARFGPKRITGETRVRESFIRYLAEIPEGQQFDPRYIERAELRLGRLGVFQSVRIDEAETVQPDGTLPLTIAVQDRKPRRIGAGVTFSSLDGLGVEGFWLHRNMWGRAERLRFDASINGIGEEDSFDDYDYNLGVTYTRPGTLQPDTSLTLGAELTQNVFDTYTEQTAAVRGGLERIVNENFTIGGGVEFDLTTIEDSTGTETFELVSTYVDATYDVRDDQLDATDGFYLTGEVRPFIDVGTSASGVRTELEGRIYQALDRDARFVLAGKATLGSVFGASRDDVPANLLFFSGGGGSVRGYEYRSKGIDIGGETFGGTGLFELSGELRAKVTENIGVVGFADVGWVSDSAWAFDDNDPRAGVGLGLRYDTGVGPIRLDIATPVDRRPGEAVVAFYLGIGQSF